MSSYIQLFDPFLRSAYGCSFSLSHLKWHVTPPFVTAPESDQELYIDTAFLFSV